MKLCSACLLGLKCRYDGRARPHKEVTDISKREILIPVCPEQLGGLATPRHASEIRGKRVVSETGEDVTGYFKKGAKEVLKIARTFHIKEAILKQRSAACGSGWVYNGTFSGKLKEGYGITAGLLKQEGIKVFSEDDINALKGGAKMCKTCKSHAKKAKKKAKKKKK